MILILFFIGLFDYNIRMNYIDIISVATGWLRSLDADTFYKVWIAFGLLGFGLWFIAAYRFARYALRHQKWRGTWFNPVQFQELVNILAEDQASGRRVMQHDEIKLLREWQLGKQFKGVGNDKTNVF